MSLNESKIIISVDSNRDLTLTEVEKIKATLDEIYKEDLQVRVGETEGIITFYSD